MSVCTRRREGGEERKGGVGEGEKREGAEGKRRGRSEEGQREVVGS